MSLEAIMAKPAGVELKPGVKTVDEPEELVEYTTQCPECKSRHIIRDYKRAELVCGKCSLVLSDFLIDQGPEWRAFDSEQEEKRARTGPPSSYLVHDKGLSTDISFGDKGIPYRNRRQIHRMRRWQYKLRLSKSLERNIARALEELGKLSSKLNAPKSVKEAAVVIYHGAVERDIVRGRSIETVMTASLYIACRQCNLPRSLDEIAEVSGLRRKDIGKTYRQLARKLGIRMKPVGPSEYVSKMCTDLELSSRAQSYVLELLGELAERRYDSGKSPLGTAGAAIYIASIKYRERRTQKEIAGVAGVTEVTIRNRYKNIETELGIDMGERFKREREEWHKHC